MGFFYCCSFVLGVKENCEEEGYCIHSYKIFHLETVTFHYGLAKSYSNMYGSSDGVSLSSHRGGKYFQGTMCETVRV